MPSSKARKARREEEDASSSAGRPVEMDSSDEPEEHEPTVEGAEAAEDADDSVGEEQADVEEADVEEGDAEEGSEDSLPVTHLADAAAGVLPPLSMTEAIARMFESISNCLHANAALFRQLPADAFKAAPSSAITKKKRKKKRRLSLTADE